MTLTITLAIIVTAVITLHFVVRPLSRKFGWWLLSKPIVYATETEFACDDPVTSPKWKKYRLGLRVLEASGDMPATIIILNPKDKP